MAESEFDRVTETAGWLRARLGAVPEIGIVLGSGLGAFADTLDNRFVVSYEDIPHWPRSTVIGHAGTLATGTVKGRPILALSGRVHLYEGCDAATVTFATRVLARSGVKVLVMTNAAGGINLRFSEGALMVIEDHLNLTGVNPLAGPNEDRFGPRFPDMSEVYSRRLRAIADQVARALKLPVEFGVYLAVSGPSYETPAEIRAFRTLGADAVGMSTVPEAIVARHMGVEVLGISCIANMAAGVLPHPLAAEDVIAATGRVRHEFFALLEGILERL